MFRIKTILAAALVLGTAGFAMAYASNPAVQARQGAMQTIGANVKALTQMVKGETGFDAAAAQAAFAAISAQAGQVPTLFEAHERDPESKASDAIWDNWDDFVAKAGALKAAADGGAGIDSPDALGAAMGPLGGACKACHTAYKL